ncbi:S-layer homology domain-containing protein [Paenibacillus xerothermodurans]|uniref:SLH domain-containing protein n=1 Tax=Paenibacillus xerothermodurans TaxID=1977292 RepID=A0A2W1NM45_PAEXE|nr:S-layer homology domain-containing protein [Paenibacillus xerothermodurans]PZE20023.1 hypothetical protein CBW46_015180 [Paenibacillus xerothermodurans]
MRSLSRKITATIGAAMLMSGAVSSYGVQSVYAAAANQDAQVKIGVSGTSYNVKQNIALPIQALNTSELMGVEFSIKYDPQVLDFIKEDTSDFYPPDKASNIVIDEQNGVLKYALIKREIPSDQTIPQAGLVTLHFAALQPAEATSVKVGDIIATTGYQTIQMNSADEVQLKIAEAGEAPTPGEPEPTPGPTPTPGEPDPGPGDTDNPDNPGDPGTGDPGTTDPGQGNPVDPGSDPTNPGDPTNPDKPRKSRGGGRVVIPVTPGTPVAEESQPDEISKQIEAAVGATIELGSQAKVIIPANALKANATVTIHRLVDASRISGLLPQGMAVKIGGDIYEITTSGENKFNKPVSIILSFDDEKLIGGKEPAIYYYHEGRKQWIFMGGQVDAASGRVSVQVNQLSTFAVFTDPTAVHLIDIDTHWAAEYITRLVGMKVITGYEDMTFKPEENVTRAEFTAMMVAALGLPADKSGKLSFADAEQIPDWAAGYAVAAVDAGIIEGRPGANGSVYFDAGALITRAEMAVMVTRTLTATASGSTAAFADAAAIPDWAKQSIETAVEKEIINGFEDNTFRPEAKATRAQAATMIFKLLHENGI